MTSKCSASPKIFNNRKIPITAGAPRRAPIKEIAVMQGRSRSIHLSVHIHKDPAAMAERAAHIFAAACEEAVSERGTFTVALSGGHTPIPFF